MNHPSTTYTCIVCGNEFHPADPTVGLCPACGGPPEALLEDPVDLTEMPRVELQPPGEPGTGSDWQPGDVILDTYEVKAVLGQGGFGKVYRVHHRAWNVDLAVKRSLNLEETSKLAFIEEAEKWINLGLHPHIVSCYYVRNIDGFPHTFAELAEGGSLKDWIEDDDHKLYFGGQAAALERILDIAIQFAWGLGYAHEKGLVHQDIKPGNVLMTPDGIAKVTDFGLAKALQPTIAGDLFVSTAGGTPAFCSPEQALRERLSVQTDIWSWGVSILEMFAGEIFWQYGKAAAEVLEGFSEEGALVPGPPPMPKALAELLRNCFQHEPSERPKDMLVIAGRLQAIYQQETGQTYSRQFPKAAELRADSLNNKALSLLDLGKSDEARAAWKKALLFSPGHLAVTSNYGLFSLSRQWLKSDELANLCNALVSAHPKDIEAAFIAACLFLEMGKIKEVENLANRMSKETSDHPLMIQLAAMLKWIKGSVAEAVKLMQPVIHTSDDIDSLMNYARYLYHLGNFEEAKTWASKVVENESKRGAFAEEWAVILCANSQRDTAREYLESFRAESDHSPLRLALAELLAGYGHIAKSFHSTQPDGEAFSIYQKAICAAPYMPRARRGYRLAAQQFGHQRSAMEIPFSSGWLEKENTYQTVPPGIQEVARFEQGKFFKTRFLLESGLLFASRRPETPPTAILFDICSGEMKPLPIMASFIEGSPNGSTLLARGEDFYHELILWDIRNYQIVSKVNVEDQVHAKDWITEAAFVCHGNAVLVLTYNGRALLFDTFSGQHIPDKNIIQLDKILSGTWQKGVLPGSEVKGLQEFSVTRPDAKLVVSRNEKLAYLASREHNWIIEASDSLVVHETSWRQALSIALSDDGHYVALGGGYGTPIRIVDLCKDELVAEFPEHENIVEFIRFLGDGRHVVWSDHRSLLVMSEITTGRRCGQFQLPVSGSPESDIRDLDVDGDGFYIAVVSDRNTLHIFRPLLEPGCALIPRLPLPIRLERPEDYTLREKREELFNSQLLDARTALLTLDGLKAYQVLRAALTVPGHASDGRALEMMPDLAKFGLKRTGLKQAWMSTTIHAERLVALSPNGYHSLALINGWYKIVSRSKAAWELPSLTSKVEAAWLPDDLYLPDSIGVVLLCLAGGQIVTVNLHLTDGENEACKELCNLSVECEALAFSADGKKVIYRLGDSQMGQIMHRTGMLALFDIDTCRFVRFFVDPGIWAISPDGSQAVTRSSVGAECICAGTTKPLLKLDTDAWVGAITADNRFLFSKVSTLAKDITIWDVTTGIVNLSPCTSINIIDQILVSRDMRFLVAADGQSITWWELDWDWEVATTAELNAPAAESYFQPARECRNVAEQPVPGIIWDGTSIYRLKDHIHIGVLSMGWKAESDQHMDELFFKRAAVLRLSSPWSDAVGVSRLDSLMTKPDFTSEVWINGYGIVYDSGIYPASDECPNRELVSLDYHLNIHDANCVIEHSAEILAGAPADIFPVLVSHFVDVEGFNCLVTRWVESETLRTVLANRRPIDLTIYLEIARKLERLHATGKIHGDLKPENVLITPDHQVYLLDPGGEVSGMVVTTVRYYPLMRYRLDDVQAFGIMLCEVLTHEHPFKGHFWDEMPKAFFDKKGGDWGDERLRKSRADFLANIYVPNVPSIPGAWLELGKDLALSSCNLQQAIKRMEHLFQQDILPDWH